MKTTENSIDLLSRAIALWGQPAQWDQIIEECAEMIAEILHFRRGRTDGNKLAEEVADAYICLEQARQMAGPDLVDSWIDQKLARLERRVTFHERRKAEGEFVTPYDDGTDGTEPYPDKIK